MRTFFRMLVVTGALGLLLSLGVMVRPTEAYQCSCRCGTGPSASTQLGPRQLGACHADACLAGPCFEICQGQGGSTEPGNCIPDDTSGVTQNCVDTARALPHMSPTRLAQLNQAITAINTREHTRDADWTCQGLPGYEMNDNKCVTGGCLGTYCCVPGTGGAPVGTAAADGPTTAPDGTAPAPVPGENCTDVAIRAGTPTTTVTTIARRVGAERSVWTCQRACTSAQRDSCVLHGCPDTDDNVRCCPPNIGIPPGQQCGGRGAAGGTANTTGGGSGSGGIGIATLLLPECATTRDPARAGKCQISDVFELGYSAVKFMFGLSGALLLVAFVYAGFMYLLNGNAGKIQDAKTTMVNAVLGMVIMLFAYIIVTFLYNALRQ